MKRLFSLTVPVFILVSCSGAQTPPADVLQKTSLATQTLMSARFDGSAQFSRMPSPLGGLVNGSLSFQGVMRDAGKQLDFLMAVDVNPPENEAEKINATLQLIVAGEDEVYMKVDALSASAGAGPAFPLMNELQNKWWRIPSTDGANSATAVTADPEFLRIQSETVDVIKDHGYQTVNGRKSHHYDVVINKDKLAEYLHEVSKRRGQEQQITEIHASLADTDMTGEMWIDAETYHIHRINWHLVPTGGTEGTDTLFTINLYEHNKDVSIQPPQRSEPFPADLMLLDASFDSDQQPVFLE